MALQPHLKLHLAKKGKQKCCCCKSLVDKDDIELWTCPEFLFVAVNNGETTHEFKRTGAFILHTLCPDCVHRIDGELCKPVNRRLGFDDAEEPPILPKDQVA
jgi:hypothetical protein